MSIYCQPCLDRGHHCEALVVTDPEPGEVPKCIFCEDSEPCPQTTHKPTALQAPRILAGDSLKVRRTRRDGVYEVAPKEKKQRMKAKDPKNCIDCGTRVRKDSVDQRCKACRKTYQAAQRESGETPRRGRPPQSAAPFAAKPKPRSNGHAIAGGGANGSGGVVALRVNERQLNDFFLRLPIADRAAMVNDWLAGS